MMKKIEAYAMGVTQVKDYVFNTAKGKVMKQTKGFGELTVTNESKALIGLFHGQTECKKNKYGKPANPSQTIGILGAGLMGAGIAQVSVDKGMKTILKDMNVDRITRGFNQVQGGTDKSVKSCSKRSRAAHASRCYICFKH